MSLYSIGCFTLGAGTAVNIVAGRWLWVAVLVAYFVFMSILHARSRELGESDPS